MGQPQSYASYSETKLNATALKGCGLNGNSQVIVLGSPHNSTTIYKFNIHTSPHPLRGAMANAAHSDMRRGPAPGALLSKSDIQQFEGS